jgi:hypothetical protein
VKVTKHILTLIFALVVLNTAIGNDSIGFRFSGFNVPITLTNGFTVNGIPYYNSTTTYPQPLSGIMYVLLNENLQPVANNTGIVLLNNAINT